MRTCIFCRTQYIEENNYGKFQCLFHPGYLKVIQYINGKQIQIYTCCKGSIHFTGCVNIDHISEIDVQKYTPCKSIYTKYNDFTFEQKIQFLNNFSIISIPTIVANDIIKCDAYSIIKELNEETIDDIIHYCDKIKIKTLNDYLQSKDIDNGIIKLYTSLYDISCGMHPPVSLSGVIDNIDINVEDQLKKIFSNDFFITKYKIKKNETINSRQELFKNINSIWIESPKEKKASIHKLESNSNNNSTSNQYDSSVIIEFSIIKRILIPITIKSQ